MITLQLSNSKLPKKIIFLLLVFLVLIFLSIILFLNGFFTSIDWGIFHSASSTIENTDLEIPPKDQVTQTLLKENHHLQLVNQYYFSISLGLILILMVGCFFIYRLWHQRQVIKKQNIELAQANAIKNQFFSIIAHDLRKPVLAFQNISKKMEYLQKNGKDGDVKKMLHQVDNAATNLNSLLDNLLHWSLIESNSFPYQPTNINLKELSNEVFYLFQPLAQIKGVKFRQHIFSNMEVYADRSSLATILRNLVSNAIKFSSTGDLVVISAKKKGSKILLKIEDTGLGMEAHIQENAFTLNEQKITSGTEGETGTGLGLLLCKKFTELNHGEISLQTQLGKGTLISVSLPKA